MCVDSVVKSPTELCWIVTGGLRNELQKSAEESCIRWRIIWQRLSVRLECIYTGLIGDEEQLSEHVSGGGWLGDNNLFTGQADMSRRPAISKLWHWIRLKQNIQIGDEVTNISCLACALSSCPTSFTHFILSYIFGKEISILYMSCTYGKTDNKVDFDFEYKQNCRILQ